MNLLRRTSRYVSLLVVMAMFMTLIVQFPVKAASAAYFTFPAYSESPAAALTKPVNEQMITEFRGTFSQAVPEVLSYTVQLMERDAGGAWNDKGTPNTVLNVNPVVSGPTSQEFYLYNVQLFAGMNKITVSTQSGVEGVTYVYYDNASVITDITLNNGVPLNSSTPAYVNNEKQFILIKANNASSVSVNGLTATSYGPGSFSLTNFQLSPGLNELVFTAESETRKYTITRYVIYVDGPGAIHNASLQASMTDDANGVPIEIGSVISRSPLPKGIKGKIAIPNNASQPTFNEVTLTVDGQNQLFSVTNFVYQMDGAPVSDGQGNNIYTFFIDLSTVSNTDWIQYNGTYQFTINGQFTVPGNNQPTTFSSRLPAFVYKDSTKASIDNVQQIFGVQEGNETGSGTASYFGSSLNSLPLYALVTISNVGTFNKDNLSVTANGSPVAFQVIAENTTARTLRVKINTLPVGDVSLQFSYTDGTNVDRYREIFLNYTPVPSIVVYGIYNGDNFSTNVLPKFDGRLINFPVADRSTLKVMLNGTTLTHTLTNDTFSVASLSNVLVEGPNELVISGTSQGVPVSTRITLYYYTAETPILDRPVPVPVGQAVDSNNRFVTVDSGVTYTTNEKTADLLIKNVSKAEQLLILKDGVQLFQITYNGNVASVPSTVVDGVSVVKESDSQFRIRNISLNLGSSSWVVKAVQGSKIISIPVTIIRNEEPYRVLSPILPDERVINQNFLKVEIQADGADSVILGKDIVMEKVTEGSMEYFVGTIYDLKAGSNDIEFTIIRGEEEIEDEFEVVYANRNIVGAQYAATFGAKNKVDVFNKELSVSFPKGTMLTPYNDTTSAVKLLDEQKMIFGIADAGGRTIRSTSHLGEKINFSNYVYLQTLLNIPSQTQHFSYASPIYWIDAGYSDSTETVNGMHPYYGMESNSKYNVWSRATGQQWLKPTERGTITISYDESIRNVAADRLTIYRYGMIDEYTVGWENVGGIVNTKNNTITASMDTFGYYVVMYNSIGFDDTQNHNFARDQMEILYAKGIMNAKNTGEFGAYEPTTRGEFATALVKALDIPLDYDVNNRLFYDVPTGNASPYWDYRYIETAGQKGFVRGVGIRQFAPGDPVTREQAAIMIAYAMNLKLNADPEKSKATLDKTFSDSGRLNYYSYTSVEAVYKAKLMQGRTIPSADPEADPMLVFAPESNITRAETAVVLVNLMKKYKLL